MYFFYFIRLIKVIDKIKKPPIIKIIYCISYTDIKKQDYYESIVRENFVRHIRAKNIIYSIWFSWTWKSNEIFSKVKKSLNQYGKISEYLTLLT